MTPRFTFCLQDGSEVRGVVQGCGGPVAGPRSLSRLKSDLRAARAGRRTSVGGPVLTVYPSWSAEGNGDPVSVDLREVLLIRLARSRTR